MKKQLVQDWPYIPHQAFLYAPKGSEIRQGNDEKQWRKIFEDGQSYETYEERQLGLLQKQLSELRIQPHSWFDKANKLRFLQANKFKIEETCKSIKEGSLWRETYFPIKRNAEAEAKLNEGTLYFCGRDREYRPILIVEITKMKSYSKEIVPVILNILLEFALDQLLIPGQVENYILIINLDDAGLSDRQSVSKIVSFTSNTYRSRLFASYLLNTPFLIASGWNAFASAIVSENTLRKIKISKEGSHEDMWKHIDKNIVEKKYGGNMVNLKGPYWPPSKNLMNYTSPESNYLKHVSKEEYNKLFKDGSLKNRKVKKDLLFPEAEISPTKNIEDKSKNEEATESAKKDKTPVKDKLDPFSIIPRNQIRTQILPPIRKRNFKLFFQETQFKQIKRPK